MITKCFNCKHQRVLETLWFRDQVTNLDIYAQYCRNCNYLCSFEGSLNPFRGFRKQNAISDKKMIDYPEYELMEMGIPSRLYDAILQDKK